MTSDDSYLGLPHLSFDVVAFCSMNFHITELVTSGRTANHMTFRAGGVIRVNSHGEIAGTSLFRVGNITVVSRGRTNGSEFVCHSDIWPMKTVECHRASTPIDLAQIARPSSSAGRTFGRKTLKKTFKFALSNVSMIILSVANGMLPLNKRSSTHNVLSWSSSKRVHKCTVLYLHCVVTET